MDQSLILYTTENCEYCWEVREFLKSRKVSFSEERVDQSAQAAKELTKLVGDQVVPVVVWHRGESSPVVVVGFDKQKLERIVEEVV